MREMAALFEKDGGELKCEHIQRGFRIQSHIGLNPPP